MAPYRRNPVPGPGPGIHQFIVSHVVVILILLLMKRRRGRRFYQHQINANRVEQGEFKNMLQELRNSDDNGERFEKVMRMSIGQFDWLLNKLAHRLEHKKNHRIPISAEERLAMTIRYLASGSDQTQIALAFRVGVSTVNTIVEEVCQVIWEELKDTFLKFPASEDEWKDIAHSYETKWNFPHCLGSIDGKHVNIQAPPNSGSSFFNYKKTHSVVLMAMCDANYCFSFVDIGSPGANSDGGIFASSTFGNALVNNPEVLAIPPPAIIPGFNESLPYVFVGDEAFPLKPNLLRPFPGRTIPGCLSHEKQVYNYRLCRARRVIENSFGILVSKWRIFRKSTIAIPRKIESYIKATVILHNFLIKSDQATTPENRKYCSPGYVDSGDEDNGRWRSIIDSDGGSLINPITRIGSNNYSRDAVNVRLKFMHYFSSRFGSVPWQDAKVSRGR